VHSGLSVTMQFALNFAFLAASTEIFSRFLAVSISSGLPLLLNRHSRA
jgi:hypothetical protein